MHALGVKPLALTYISSISIINENAAINHDQITYINNATMMPAMFKMGHLELELHFNVSALKLWQVKMPALAATPGYCYQPGVIWNAPEVAYHCTPNIT